jgi:hypothetical protein
LTDENDRCSRVAKAIPHANTKTKAVRIAVARFDGTSLTPILAKMAVTDAEIAAVRA